ncbi:hypothetical protein ABPG72_002205 [Tetrahymena utriculariae]
MSNFGSEVNSPINLNSSFNQDLTIISQQKLLNQQLNINLLYDSLTTNGLGNILSESENIANKIIQKIIVDGGNILYDKYLQEKMNDHSINRIINLIEYVQKQEYLFYDDINEDILNNGVVEDTEPSPTQHENWKGLAVSIEKQLQPSFSQNNLSQREIDQISVAQSKRTIATHDRMRKSDVQSSATLNALNPKRESMIIKSAFENEKIPKPIDLSIPREIIREEEQLRILKEREILIKQEKMQMEAIRNQELKEQQARLKGMQDVNKKLFTYDFDGKFILTNPVKLEKLPPFNYAVTHSITKFEGKPNQLPSNQTANNSNNTSIINQQQLLDAADEKRNSKKLLQPLIAVQKTTQMQQFKQSQQLEKDKLFSQQNAIVGDQGKEVFEHFSMASGVTLIDANKQKAGPKFGANLDYSIVNQTNLNRTLLDQSNSIRMTKSEYNAITRAGNLSRQNKQEGSTIDQDGQNQTELHGGAQGGLSFLLNDSKLKNYSQFNNSINQRQKRGSNPTSQIKIADPSKLIETIHNLDQQNEDQLKELEQLKQQQNPKKSFSTSNILKMTPIDEFNMQIYQNKHVADKKSDLLSLPPIPIPKPNEFLRAKQTLGFLPQNPRERAPKRVIVASISGKRLPPPGLGKTIGHGFDQGINPDKLDSLEGILEKIQNYSMLNGSQILR